MIKKLWFGLLPLDFFVSSLRVLFFFMPLKKAFFALGLSVLLFGAGCQNRAPSEKVEKKSTETSKGSSSKIISPKVTDSNKTSPQEKQTTYKANTIDEVLQGEWRGRGKERDLYRHPRETLSFFGIKPEMTIAEVWPGRGWYTQILAPWLHANGGQLIIVHPFDTEKETEQGRNSEAKQFLENFRGRFKNKVLYGNLKVSRLSSISKEIAPENSLDAVVTFRNLHNWMEGRYVEKVFQDFYRSLKPGGILGIVEHRFPSSRLQDPFARSGYVQEEYVKKLAEEAGFEFMGRSEINANPKDNTDHPFGVWTLRPTRKSPKVGSKEAEGFDREAYDMIGESDRMTLKFRKPVRQQNIKEKQIPDKK